PMKAEYERNYPAAKSYAPYEETTDKKDSTHCIWPCHACWDSGVFHEDPEVVVGGVLYFPGRSRGSTQRGECYRSRADRGHCSGRQSGIWPGRRALCTL